MLRIAQIADCHLGYSSGRRYDKQGYNLRVLDGYRAYHEAIAQMIKEKVDVLLMTGDIFHMAHPDIRTIIEAQQGFRDLADAGIPVYCIVGNHDATDIRSEIPASGVLNEPANKIYSYTTPYYVKEIFPGVVCHFLSHHAYTDQGETMKKIKLIPDKINILVSHGSCFDTNLNTVLHCPQEPREVVIPEFVMNLGWDYTFLGHIHERGWIGSKDGKTDTENRKQFYGGSILRRGFTDKPCKLGRGWTLWTIDDNKKFTPTFFNVWQRNQFDLPRIKAKDLTANEIEDILVKQLQDVMEKCNAKDGKIKNEYAPIVRQTIVDVDSLKYVAIDWSKTSRFTNQFLSYTLRKKESQEQIDENDVADLKADSDKNTGKDISEVFDNWLKNERKGDTIPQEDKVIEVSKRMLDKGQAEILENQE